MFRKLLCIFLLLPLLAFAESFVEGKDYILVKSPTLQPIKNKKQIQAFFSYGCPWCYRIEAPLEIFLSKNKVEFERIPLVFKPSWQVYAEAFYVAQALDLSKRFNPLLFQAIQVDKKNLESKEAMIAFFAQQGVDHALVQSAFLHAPSIELKVKDGMNLMSAYQISSIPAFVVNQQYKTGLDMAGSPERLVEILNYLVKLG